MTVIVGVLTGQHLLLAADRAVIDPAHPVTRGVPAVLDDRDKVFLTACGTAVAMAGLIGDGSAAGDLLAAAQAAPLSGTPGAVAAELTALFDQMAPRLRATPAAAASAMVVPQFEREVLTVALVGGASTAGPDLWAVGLTRTGRCVTARLDEPGAAYGPQSERANLAAAVEQAASLPSAVGGSYLAGVIAEVAVRNHESVSVDCDWLLMAPGISAPLVAHRPRLEVPHGL